MKAGWKTTEFWKALVTNVMGLLLLFGVVGPDTHDTVLAATTALAGAVISAAATVGYSMSRGSAKSNQV